MESGSQKVDCCRKRKPERTNSTTHPPSKQGRLLGGGSHYPETDLQNEERERDLQQGEWPGQRLRALESTRPVT